MSNQVFQQNLDDKKGPQPGGPYLIQMLFKEPVDMPDKETMTAVIEKHIGSTECFCYDKQMTGFAAQEHIAEFKDGKCPVQLMVMKCDRFKGKGFDAFLMSQMWDCQEADVYKRQLCWRESWRLNCWQLCGSRISRSWPLKLPRTGICPPRRCKAGLIRCAPIWNWCRAMLLCCMK